MEKKEWGFANGYKVYLYTLKNKNGMTLKLTNYSGAIVSAALPDKKGNMVDVVLGYDNLEGYISGGSSQGALVGRYANRIANGEFTLNGKTYKLVKNCGAHTLHGGGIGFNKRVWTIDEEGENTVTFGYFSPDGEENFPGNLKVQCKYTLTDDNAVKLEYSAESDADTIINLTNHSYFNLNGVHGGSVMNTTLQIFAENYTLVTPELIPTGVIASVHGTVFDFTQPKRIGEDVDSGKIDGYDHNFLLGDPFVLRKSAYAVNPDSGITMTMFTDMPAMQLYTANGLGGEIGKDGIMMEKQTAFCLESQFCPDAPHHDNFASPVLKAGESFKSTTIYQFGIE
ncbi:MAG: aldose epimerase family protein [Ruminiclostridium sp.]